MSNKNNSKYTEGFDCSFNIKGCQKNAAKIFSSNLKQFDNENR